MSLSSGITGRARKASVMKGWSIVPPSVAAAAFARRSAASTSAIGGVRHEAADRQRDLGEGLSAVRDDDPAADRGDAPDGRLHRRVVRADDDDVVRVVRDGRRHRAPSSGRSRARTRRPRCRSRGAARRRRASGGRARRPARRRRPRGARAPCDAPVASEPARTSMTRSEAPSPAATLRRVRSKPSTRKPGPSSMRAAGTSTSSFPPFATRRPPRTTRSGRKSSRRSKVRRSARKPGATAPRSVKP